MMGTEGCGRGDGWEGLEQRVAVGATGGGGVGTEGGRGGNIGDVWQGRR